VSSTLPPSQVARLVAVVAGLLVLQMAVVSRVELFGVSGNVLVVVPIVVGFLAGPERGAAAGFLAGLGVDLLVSTPLGLTALVWSLAGYGCGLATTALVRPGRATLLVLAALGAAGATAGFALVGAIFGQEQLIEWRLVRICLVTAIVAVAVALPLLPVLRWATADHLDPVHRRR